MATIAMCRTATGQRLIDYYEDDGHDWYSTRTVSAPCLRCRQCGMFADWPPGRRNPYTGADEGGGYRTMENGRGQVYAI